jgi:hypothetical protein
MKKLFSPIQVRINKILNKVLINLKKTSVPELAEA